MAQDITPISNANISDPDLNNFGQSDIKIPELDLKNDIDESPRITSSVYQSTHQVPRQESDRVNMNHSKAASLGKNMLQYINQNKKMVSQPLRYSESNNLSHAAIKDIQAPNIDFNNRKMKQDMSAKPSAVGRRLTKDPRTSFNFQDNIALDKLDFISQNDLKENDQYLQQSNNLEMFEQKSMSNIDEEKVQNNIEDGTQVSNLETQRIRGGAVTQGFIRNDRKRKSNQRKPASNHQDPRTAQSTNHDTYPKPQHLIRPQPIISPHHLTSPQFDSPAYYEPPAHAHAHLPHTDSLPIENHHHHPHQHQHHNHPNQHQQQISIPSHKLAQFYQPSSTNNEHLKTMNDMMTSMLMFQHNNFKAMMDSHTHLMTKIIDKVQFKNQRQR